MKYSHGVQEAAKLLYYYAKNRNCQDCMFSSYKDNDLDSKCCLGECPVFYDLDHIDIWTEDDKNFTKAFMNAFPDVDFIFTRTEDGQLYWDCEDNRMENPEETNLLPWKILRGLNNGETVRAEDIVGKKEEEKD